ncbi:MAG: 5-formyltetrahydrofolate cyclo-ligase [Flavobacterium sp. BFFFF2]|nr:MAG: 5-formyltetrahydrofolate cyclo-ligase [Flavobacterium sp. BFFFF2]
MQKKDYRQQFIQAREQLSDEQTAALNQHLLHHFQAFNWEAQIHFHVFLSIAQKKEVATQPIIDWLWQQQKKVYTSITNWETNTLETVLFEPHTHVKLGAFGIPEPVHATKAPAANMDVVLVPLLAFDERGHRVGYGKGIYDRFLKQCRPDVLKVGLSLFDHVKQIADVSAFDVPLDLVFTPDRVYSF